MLKLQPSPRLGKIGLSGGWRSPVNASMHCEDTLAQSNLRLFRRTNRLSSLDVIRTIHEVNLKTESTYMRDAFQERSNSKNGPKKAEDPIQSVDASKLAADSKSTDIFEAEAFETPDGYFRRYEGNSKTWTETDNLGNEKFRFLETRRDSNFIYIRDSSRSVDLRFQLGVGASGMSVNGGDTWTKWHDVKKVAKPNSNSQRSSN